LEACLKHHFTPKVIPEPQICGFVQANGSGMARAYISSEEDSMANLSGCNAQSSEQALMANQALPISVTYI
jgi:hypothetical protein